MVKVPVFFDFGNGQICIVTGRFCRRIIDKGLFHKFVFDLGHRRPALRICHQRFRGH